MRNIFRFIKEHPYFSALFLILVAVRVWYVINPSPVWWDTSIYIGMGKHIYSGGYIGIWENFRPLLFPLLLGLSWKIHFDPLVFGKLFVFFGSIGSLLLAYLLGKKIEGEKTGILSMLLLGVTPIFFYYTNVQITDIPSVCMCLLSLYFFTQKKYFWSGLISGIAFSLRFPQGLVIIPIALSIVIGTLEFHDFRRTALLIVKRLFFFLLGFSIIIVPYLIFNLIRYGDMFLPFELATKILLGGAFYLYDKGIYFYFIEVFKQNPFSLFALVGIIIAGINYRRARRNPALLSICLSLLFFVGYFSWQPHKELRYGIAFLPYIFVLSGYALISISNKLPKKMINASLFVIALLIAIFLFSHRGDIRKPSMPEENRYFETYFEGKGYSRVLTTSPTHLIYENIKILELYDSWEAGIDALHRRYERHDVDYVTLDTSQIFCQKTPDECSALEDLFISDLDQKGNRIYYHKASDRELYIYRVK